MDDVSNTMTNNPGNLRPPGGKTDYYEGQIGVNKGGFAIFSKQKYGEQALEQDIRAKLRRPETATPGGFVMMYAPPKSAGGDNSDEAYANYVEQIGNAFNKGPNDTIDPTPENIKKLREVITRVEGTTNQQIESGELPEPVAPETPGFIENASQTVEQSPTLQSMAQWANENPLKTLGIGAASAIYGPSAVRAGVNKSLELLGKVPGIAKTGVTQGAETLANVGKNLGQAVQYGLQRGTGPLSMADLKYPNLGRMLASPQRAPSIISSGTEAVLARNPMLARLLGLAGPVSAGITGLIMPNTNIVSEEQEQAELAKRRASKPK